MFLVMAKSHCTCTCIKSSKEFLRVVCENITCVHKFLTLWWFEMWEHQGTLTHNHNCSMGTITFEVHPITPTSPRNMLATIFKSILILFLLLYSLHIFFLNISCMGIYRERINTQLCKPKRHNFAMPKHKYFIHDWRALVVRWLFMPFS